MQDATKVLLGATPSSAKEVTSYPADPATFKAGLAVRAKSDGGLLLADDSTAALVGVSLGPDLSNTKNTAVARTGDKIPLQLKTGFSDPALGAPVYVDDTLGQACADDDEDAVLTSAVYVSAPLTGVFPDATETPVVLINLNGGF